MEKSATNLIDLETQFIKSLSLFTIKNYGRLSDYDDLTPIEALMFHALRVASIAHQGILLWIEPQSQIEKYRVDFMVTAIENHNFPQNDLGRKDSVLYSEYLRRSSECHS